LDFTCSALTWNNFAGATANNISLTVAGANYVFSDSAEVINFGPGVPGTWSGNGTNTVTGPVASVTSLTINAGAGAASDVLAIDSPISVPGLVSITGLNIINVNQSLTTTAGGALTLTANAQATSTLTIAANVTSAGVATLTGRGSLLTSAAVSTTNQNIIFRTDDITLGGTANAGAARVRFETFTAARPIDLGTKTAGKLSLTDAELDLVTALAVRVGLPSNTGGTVITAALSAPAGWNILAVRNGSTLTQTVGSSITVNSLLAQGSAGVTLDQPGNNVAVLAGRAAVTPFVYRDADAVTVAGVDTVNGVVTAGGNIMLTADNMTFNAAVNAGAASVTLQPLTLSRPITVGTKPGTSLGLLQTDLNNITAAILRLGSLSHTGGIAVTAAVAAPAGWNTLALLNVGAISQTPGTSLTVSNLLARGGAGVALPNAGNSLGAIAGTTSATPFNIASSVPLTVGTVDAVSGIATAGGEIIVTADSMDIVSPVNAGTGTVTLQSLTAGRLITLGTEVPGTLALTDAEIDQVAAGILRIGRSSAGTVTQTAAMSSTPATLSLITGSAITQSAGVLTATTLALQAVTGIGSTTPLSTSVTNLAFANTGSNDVQIENAGPLVINNADTLTTSSNAGGAARLGAGSPITFNINTSSLGDLVATADENPVPTPEVDNITVNAAVIVQSGNGDVIFQAGDDIVINATATVESLAGDITFTAGFADNDLDGDIDLDGDLNAAGAGGIITLELRVTGTVDQGAGTLTATNLLVLGPGTFRLIQPGNDVDELAADITGSLTYRDADALTVGSVATTDGISTGGGNVTLCTDTGNLLLDEAIDAPSGTARLQATAGSVIAQSASAVITAAELGVVAGLDINLGVAVNQIGSVFAADAAGSIQFSNGAAFSIGAVAAADCFAGADGVGGGGDITLCVAGDLDIAAPLSGNTVRLQVGSVSQTAVITALNLGINAAGSIDLYSVANEVTDQFAATTITTLADPPGRFIRFLNDEGFRVGQVTAIGCFEGATGVSTVISNITLRNQTQDLEVDFAITTGASVFLRSAGTVTQDGVITAAALGVIADGNVTLDALNAVGTFAADVSTAAGADVIFRDSEDLTIGAIAGNILFGPIAGVKTLNGDFTLTVGESLLVNTDLSLGTGNALMTYNAAGIADADATFNEAGIVAASARLVGANAGTDALTMTYAAGSVFTINGANAPAVTQGNVKDNGGKITPANGLQFERIETFNGASGVDTFNVTVTSPGFTTTLHGRGENDIFNLGAGTLDNLLGEIVVIGGLQDSPTTKPFPCGPKTFQLAGDLLNINDQADASENVAYSFQAAAFQRTGAANVSFIQVEIIHLAAGTGTNTISVAATAAGTHTVLATGAKTTTIDVGAGAVSQVLGRVCANGLKVNPTGQSSTLEVTVDCALPDSVSNTLDVGQVLNVNDQTHPGNNNYFVNVGNIVRQENGQEFGKIFYKDIGTINLKAGTGNNRITVTDTPDMINLNVLTGDGNNNVVVADTGARANTTVQTGQGIDTHEVWNTGTGSVTIMKAEGGADRLTVGPDHPFSVRTGDNSGVRLGGGEGDDILIATMEKTGAGSLVLLKGWTGNDTFNLTFSPTGAPGGLAGVDGGPGNDTMNFPNLNQLNTPLLSPNVNVAGSGTLTLNSTPPPPAKLVQCYKDIETIPGTAFKVASFLLPTFDPKSGKPNFRIVVIGSEFIGTANLVNTPFAPVIAQPNPSSPYGFAAPTVAVGDVNQDGVPDLIVAMGSGYAPLVTVFDGGSIFRAGQASEKAPTILAEFFAYDSNFPGGLYVAAGKIKPTKDDGAPVTRQPHIITGAGRGGGPHVQAFEFVGGYTPTKFPGGGAKLVRSFFAYDATFVGGVRVATGNVNGDLQGIDEIITGPGPGGGAHVKVFDIAAWNPAAQPQPPVTAGFMAYDNFFGGIFVAAADTNKDGRAEIMTGRGFSGDPLVKVFNLAAWVGGVQPPLIADFLAFPSPSVKEALGQGPFTGNNPLTAGVSGVAFGDTDNDQVPELIAGAGLGQPAELRVFNLDETPKDDSFFALTGTLPEFGPNVLLAAVNVAGILL
jgi:hypothetical protein